jgi:hypothetical protein
MNNFNLFFVLLVYLKLKKNITGKNLCANFLRFCSPQKSFNSFSSFFLFSTSKLKVIGDKNTFFVRRNTYIETIYIETTYIETTYIKTTYIKTIYILTTYIETTYIETTYIETTYIKLLTSKLHQKYFENSSKP